MVPIEAVPSPGAGGASSPGDPDPPLRIGMIGGGAGAFIGAVHRTAAALDGEAVLVAGAFSSAPERSIASGRSLGLAPERCHGTWAEMLASESARRGDDRLDLIVIVTPNHAHFGPARAFAAAGFDVVLDKPMVTSSEEAAELAEVVAEQGTLLAVTYNYSGYPMARQARAMVEAGELGRIRKVFVEYHQGWLATPLESTGQKQADWRTDPARAGIGGCVGDIGTHAAHLAGFVSGLELEQVCADVTTFVEGRRLDDDAAVLLRFRGGAKGVLTCSQVCHGSENGLRLRVHGERGSLAWSQEQPNRLEACGEDGVWRTLTRGGAGLHPSAEAATRLPGGHPEGFHEAFANIYRDVFASMRARRAGQSIEAAAAAAALVPDVVDGARGVRFIEAVVASGAAGGCWITL